MKIIRRRRRAGLYGLLLLILVLAGYSSWALLRPLPLLMPTKTSIVYAPVAKSDLAWPGEQAAVSIMNTDILEANGQQKPVPIASVAKVITALVVLDKNPLPAGQTGPTYTLSAADVALYHNYLAQDGSLVPVTTGEKITQFQMLQAIMLPSANNLADSLAIASFGSLEAYSSAANAWLTKHGLANTHVGSDASGLSPTTTSTAEDLVKIGNLAMRNPVLAQIVSQSTATGIPLTSSVKNYNSLLGSDGIVGIKTGNSDQAGGVFLSASKMMINGTEVTVLTAVAGAPSLAAALQHSQQLIRSAHTNTTPQTIVSPGDLVAFYNTAWGPSVKVIADQQIKASAWNGRSLKTTVELKPIKLGQPAAGQAVLPASALNPKQTSGLHLAQQPPAPSLWWRLKYPLHEVFGD